MPRAVHEVVRKNVEAAIDRIIACAANRAGLTDVHDPIAVSTSARLCSDHGWSDAHAIVFLVQAVRSTAGASTASIGT